MNHFQLQVKNSALSLEITQADTFLGRFLGLMGKKALPPFHGLLLIPCSSVHMCFMRFPIDVVLVTELADEENEDEWVFPLEGDSADLDDIVRTVFVLSLDSKLLCKEDCKGICQRCGKNLNDGPCSCQKELDPRFAALKQLLEK